MKYWLIKSEPFVYSWEMFLIDGLTYWDGIRKHKARNNLKNMENGNLVCFYHSNEVLEVVGLAKVIRKAYQDHTPKDQPLGSSRPETG